MPELTAFISGTPKGQPRPRAFARGNRAAVYDPGTAEGWKGQIALAVQGLLPPAPIAGPVYVSITFYLPRPKRLMRKKDPDEEIPHTGKPDLDNLVKAVFDALTQVGLWEDDSQVYSSVVHKVYVAKGGRPGAGIMVKPLAEEDG